MHEEYLNDEWVFKLRGRREERWIAIEVQLLCEERRPTQKLPVERVNSFGKACSTNSQRAKVCHQIRASASDGSGGGCCGSDKRVTPCKWVSAQIMLSPSQSQFPLSIRLTSPFLALLSSAAACMHILRIVVPLSLPHTASGGGGCRDRSPGTLCETGEVIRGCD